MNKAFTEIFLRFGSILNVQFFLLTHLLDKSRVEMTCDNVNGKLDNIANHNNNNNYVSQHEINHRSNGKIKSEVPITIVDEEELETRKSLMILAVIFTTAIFALFYIYKNFPKLDE